MLLHGGAVVDDCLFFGREVPEGHVRAHAHRAADVRHERPHEALPGRDRTFVDRLRFVGDERCPVHRAHEPRARAGRACPAAVEGEVFRGRRPEMRAADRADELKNYFKTDDDQGKLNLWLIDTYNYENLTVEMQVDLNVISKDAGCEIIIKPQKFKLYYLKMVIFFYIALMILFCIISQSAIVFVFGAFSSCSFICSKPNNI